MSNVTSSLLRALDLTKLDAQDLEQCLENNGISEACLMDARYIGPRNGQHMYEVQYESAERPGNEDGMLYVYVSQTGVICADF